MNRVFSRKGKGEKRHEQKTDQPFMFSTGKNPQAICQSTGITGVNERVDDHLQDGVPLAVEPQTQQVQRASEKNPVLVVRGKPGAPRQMPLQPGLE